MTIYIHAEFWITCSRCGQETVQTGNAPSTNLQPRTKQEAWEAAHATGWSGSYSRPVCPECKVTA